MNERDAPMGEADDFIDTRVHILTAGRELLLAAKGALQFCSKYVEASEVSAPHVKSFFKKAISVTDDLSAGLKNMDAIKRAAKSAITPIFTAIEKDLADDRASTSATRKSSRRSAATRASRTETAARG